MTNLPIDAIKTIDMVIGHRCHVHSHSDGVTRTLTITTEAGHICTFKGAMTFTFVLNPTGTEGAS